MFLPNFTYIFNPLCKHPKLMYSLWWSVQFMDLPILPLLVNFNSALSFVIVYSHVQCPSLARIVGLTSTLNSNTFSNLSSFCIIIFFVQKQLLCTLIILSYSNRCWSQQVALVIWPGCTIDLPWMSYSFTVNRKAELSWWQMCRIKFFVKTCNDNPIIYLATF